MGRKLIGPMKLLIMLALISGGLSANESNLDLNHTKILQIVENIYKNFAAGDIEASLQEMDENIVWEHPAANSGIPFAGTFQGHDGVRRFFSIAMEKIDVLDQQVHDLVASGNKVVALGYEHMRVKKNGREYKSNWAHVYSFKDGKVIRFEEFIDTAEVAAAFNGN